MAPGEADSTQKLAIDALVRMGPSAAGELAKPLDKKVQRGRIRLILLRKIGEALITADYPEAALEHTLQEYFGPARG